jgi:hypothetical protein
MHKMLFNTGVRPYNRLSAKDGQFHLGEWEVIKDGSIHVIYFLEHKPEDNLRLDYLQSDISDLPDYKTAIKIVDGSMLSDYAIFTKLI